ncbi:cornifelin homolog A-like [Anneissia japonica]|uniref:cornifelin homolog A-like n=1 Tax=Anneissia japonica TaxID=1529436 RepID=UPI00142581F4|nr:cornifelin homolog A-like [Anneissia japonica]
MDFKDEKQFVHVDIEESMTDTVVTQQTSVVTTQQLGVGTTQQQVVVNQTPSAMIARRQWSTGLFGCFSDIDSCLGGLFCGPFFICHLANKAGECCCAPYCVPGAMIAIRMKVRTRLNIQGSLCTDCCVLCCCGGCAACQMHREINNSANGSLQ